MSRGEGEVWPKVGQPRCGFSTLDRKAAEGWGRGSPGSEISKQFVAKMCYPPPSISSFRYP